LAAQPPAVPARPPFSAQILAVTNLLEAQAFLVKAQEIHQAYLERKNQLLAVTTHLRCLEAHQNQAGQASALETQEVDQVYSEEDRIHQAALV